MAELMQFLLSGVTVGAVYALFALGFTFIYNSSEVVNFAQGEFVMIGGMVTFFAAAAGVPLWVAALLAIVTSVLVGLALHKLAIEPARGASVVALGGGCVVDVAADHQRACRQLVEAQRFGGVAAAAVELIALDRGLAFRHRQVLGDGAVVPLNGSGIVLARAVHRVADIDRVTRRSSQPA